MRTQHHQATRHFDGAPARAQAPGCFWGAEQVVDVPAFLKIDAADDTIALFGCDQDHAAIARSLVHQRGGGPLGKPRFHLGGRVVRSCRLADRAKEDIGQVTSVALAVWTDGDFHRIFAVPTSTSADKCEHNSKHGC